MGWHCGAVVILMVIWSSIVTRSKFGVTCFFFPEGGRYSSEVPSLKLDKQSKAAKYGHKSKAQLYKSQPTVAKNNHKIATSQTKYKPPSQIRVSPHEDKKIGVTWFPLCCKCKMVSWRVVINLRRESCFCFQVCKQCIHFRIPYVQYFLYFGALRQFNVRHVILTNYKEFFFFCYHLEGTLRKNVRLSQSRVQGTCDPPFNEIRMMFHNIFEPVSTLQSFH